MKIFQAIVCTVLFASVASWAQESPAFEEERCFDHYRQGEYERVVDCLNSFLYTATTTDTARLIAAYEYLGVCLMMVDKKLPARAAFDKLLGMDADYELNPNKYLPEVISLFQIAKFEKKTSLRVMIVDSMPAYSAVFNLIPGGAPQYMNGEKKKAFLLGVTSIASLALSIYAYTRESSFESGTYGYREEDVAKARRYHVMHQISVTVFLGGYLYGIIDGFVNKRIVVKQ
ncbi:MAG: hypothetical protein A2268_04580 [Candidatus Raymondbacteria bacterium RifOxyA12_full_50_37]|nr:MAG: hypothetical protein A2268_04580 [Candidatus Raymondbacteria bacterium RifOxyA12_full_50_37]OGJ94027.1 MAG: hypothetical protein A2248_11780 [Candidatus Raymondbacteria bacterium RIFOXYA2_FULL_49_16]OGJ96853.1 MAG: hypothetical protein A2453_04385 [Candidatus Raymondbacteria bacterium RIFOXYC2_FULL_50_21]OGP41775.1 MAG: hypothetical protein A2324_18155 [Candidatus Raymondbacteria bacterium RIFOXYB2_FULL_49_35]